ncbi:hypothetical protein PPEP_a0638 [Pseudoalteromonas peptidolytica F12-50-A1]|uniref:Uncharacterized protein n=1 Tax=Pseudoalteromonas peptidolytica F12-50-A1 TaxID=1315280 RepID=A0A8I0MUL9_9GAMM|nr:hypothetical protein [Pseudoalteromonas peptidolytica F12-50-A1]
MWVKAFCHTEFGVFLNSIFLFINEIVFFALKLQQKDCLSLSAKKLRTP